MDVTETKFQYESACHHLGVAPSSLIGQVLSIEKERAERGMEIYGTLYLAGNNKTIKADRLADNDVHALYQALRINLFVVDLDLRYNNITDKGCGYLQGLIEENMTLKSLNLMCNDFEEAGAQCIATALHSNTVLLSLRVNGNKFGNRGGMCFAQALQVNSTLEELDMGDTDLKIESLIALSTVLKYNCTLKALNVNRPLLFTYQEETTVHFAETLIENHRVEELHLMKHDMRDFGIQRVMEGLRENYTLAYLNISCNRISRDGATDIASLLRYNNFLKVLDLGFNRIGDDGAKAIAESLLNFNTSLHTLVLTSNEIAGAGLCAIADALRYTTVMQCVYIWGNVLEESGCIAFGALLETGRLQPKNTDVRPYLVDGMTYLAELNNGIRKHYYWGPTYGEQARDELQKLLH